ncbi:MAG: 16S rRNA (adenine(1518)-N(6)/adenine(1519)-N(6))-dimethyltransferase RsmA [Planctomycetota bacterium]
MSPEGLPAFLRAHGLTPRARLGQHFLTDEGVLESIVAGAAIDPERDVVLEIGPGPGTLTRHIVQSGASVVAVEIDERFRAPVLERLGWPCNLHWINGDILAGKHRLAPEPVRALRRLGAGDQHELVLVANLPYQIAVPSLMNLLEADLGFRGGAVTVQKELADRLVATPGSRDYGPASVFLRAAGSVRIVRRLKPGSFWPPPAVSSAVVTLELDPGWRGRLAPFESFRKLVTGLFRYRRKGLLAALRTYLGASLRETDVVQVAQCLGVGRRPETLDVDEFLELARALSGGALRGC